MNPFRWVFRAGWGHLSGPQPASQPASQPAPQPARTCRHLRKPEGASLRGLPTGSSGRVAALTGGHGLIARLATLGLTPGVAFEVAQNSGYGPVIVLVRDTRLALGRGEAAHVLVAPTEAVDGGPSA